MELSKVVKMIKKLYLPDSIMQVICTNGCGENAPNTQIIYKVNEIIDWINHNNHEYESIEDVIAAADKKQSKGKDYE